MDLTVKEWFYEISKLTEEDQIQERTLLEFQILHTKARKKKKNNKIQIFKNALQMRKLAALTEKSPPP